MKTNKIKKKKVPVNKPVKSEDQAWMPSGQPSAEIKTEFFRALAQAFYTLEGVLGDIATMDDNPTNIQRDKQLFKFIPLDLEGFFRSLTIVRQHMSYRRYSPLDYIFSEFGAGVATKLRIVRNLNWFKKAIGYEINDSYIKVAQRILWGDSLSKIDLRKMDDFSITERTVAYYYCPMADGTAEIKFEQELEDRLPAKSYVVAHLKRNLNINKDDRFIQIGGNVWYKR